MKTLNLTAELSSFAMETIDQPLPPRAIIGRVQHFLAQRMDVVGQFLECQLIEDKRLDPRIQVKHYDLRYEKRTLCFRFTFFQPRGTWQIQGFHFR